MNGKKLFHKLCSFSNSSLKVLNRRDTANIVHGALELKTV